VPNGGIFKLTFDDFFILRSLRPPLLKHSYSQFIPLWPLGDLGGLAVNLFLFNPQSSISSASLGVLGGLAVNPCR
jgi:hypothetical protein